MPTTPSSSPAAPPLATAQDGYPRPQLVRAGWADLTGTWSFQHDDEGAADLSRGLDAPRDIVVPYPPESIASGVGESGFHPVVWYSRTIEADDLDRAGRSPAAPRVLLHFGAVDFRATVWIDGALVGTHEGGHTPFSFDVTAHLGGADPHLLVVRAEDDPHDPAQPRGKQDWHEEPHAIWYRRTTGIWQPVWLEAVPVAAMAHVRWTNREDASVGLRLRFDGRVAAGSRVRVDLRWEEGGEDLGRLEASVPAVPDLFDVVVPVARQVNGQALDELRWSPEHPRLVDASVTLLGPDGAVLDAVSSYFGVRTVGIAGRRFLLNGRPYDVRSVLDQGYWPDSHLAAPSAAALREEVGLIKAMGFTAVRLHQKVEDPRFALEADRQGLLVWAEMPAPYAFTPVAVQRSMREWMAAVERDASHPSVVTWVPVNESWGVQQVARDPAQQALARSLADVARALDPTRPVISNDGWEHPGSDILSVHDYEGDGARLAATYADEAARTRLLAGPGPAGRAILVGGAVDEGQPVMLTEFGGIDFQPGGRRDDSWGYTAATDGDDFVARLTALYDAIRSSPFLAGSCYTQFTDTLQETNGLLTADRRPKVPIERIRRAVLGRDAPRVP